MKRNDRSERLPRNKKLIFTSLALVAGAALFYWVVAFANNQPVSVQSASSDASGGESTVSSAVPSSRPASSAQSNPDSSAASQPAEQTVRTVSLNDADKPLWIQVDIEKQKVTVYDAGDRVVQNYICSTGKPGDDTPTGTFKTQQQGKSFFSQKYQEGAYYWTRFQGEFLFHSVPFDKNQKIEPEEAAKLGEKASHGCVRLAVDNAKWIYDNIPSGTKVVIE